MRLFKMFVISLMFLQVTPAIASSATPSKYLDGPPRPCRFQIQKPDGKWSKLVGRQAIRQTYRVNPNVRVRKAPLTRKYVPRFIRCLAKFYGISVQKSLDIAWCESKYYNIGGSHHGIWQYDPRTWNGVRGLYGHPRDSAFNQYAATRVTMRYVKAGGWGPWECRLYV